MAIHICVACGTSYANAPNPPAHCPICEDERQFVPRSGQAWTTPAELASAHANTWRLVEPDLFEIHTVPDFAIGQRALLIRTPSGNYLWDCLALLDDSTVALVTALGGLAGIAISHPHYYTRCQDWARAFDCPVHLHAADREWVMRLDPAIQFWDGETLALAPALMLVRLGGHFPGSAVLHWTCNGPDDTVLLTGDTLQMSPDPRRVSFLWSYPNRIPLSARSVRRIVDVLASYPIDRLYGFSTGCSMIGSGNTAIEFSAQRYIQLLSEDH